MNTFTENSREIRTSKGTVVKITTWWIFHTEGEFVCEVRSFEEAIRSIVCTDASMRGVR